MSAPAFARSPVARQTFRHMRIGLISDTHGMLRREALAALGGVECILHAGDIGSEAVLEGLRALAPVHAVRGNNDRGAWAEAIPPTLSVELEGVRAFVLHDLGELEGPPAGVAVVVSGHSHQPRIEAREGVLFINPGSAGPRRFRLPVTVGFLELDAGRARGHIQPLL